MDRGLLRQLLRTAFNEAELQDLCFEININYEELAGRNTLEKIRELIAYCQRIGKLPDLITVCQAMRPHLDWQAALKTSDATTEQSKLEQAIVALEAQRVTLGDAIVAAALAPLRQQLEAIKSPMLPPQRKQVTVLVARQSGFTMMYQDTGLEALRDMINLAWERLDVAVRQHGGWVNSRSGEQLTALFGAETAHADDPARAVKAALAMQASLAEMKKEQGVPLSIRIGLSTGSVLLEQVSTGSEFSIIGDAVKVASKLEEQTPPDGILMADSTYDQVRGIFDVAAAQPIVMRGRAEPLLCYVVLGVRANIVNSARHGIAGVTTRMVGRDFELRQLTEAFLAAAEDSERQMITITGDSGLGKSRLLDELFDWLELRTETVRFFKGEAYAEGENRPFGLLRDMLSQSIPGLASANVEQMRQTLEARLTQVLFSDAQATMKAHFIGQLLGFDFTDSPHLQEVVEDAKQLQDRATLYLIEYFQVINRLNPVVILLENLQWADDSTLDLLKRLTLALVNQQVLIVVTCRPSFLERRPHWSEGYAWHTQLDLQPLSHRHSRSLLGEILQKIDKPPKALQQNILDRAAGNPLYMIEIVKMLLRQGTIIEEGEAWLVQAEQLERLSVPSTLVGILQVSLDTLSAPEQSALKRAAVVGTTFWNRTVAYLAGSALEEQLQRTNQILTQLHGREFISRREISRFAATDEYVFRNTMLHQVAQESVPKRARRVYHGLAAKWLLEQQGDRTDEYASDIAEHLAQSGQSEKALPWFQQAGDQAAARYAHAEAIVFYSRALVLTSEEDVQTRVDLLRKREETYHVRGERTLQGKDIAQLESLVANQDVILQGRVSLRRARYAEAIGDYPVAIKAAQNCLELAKQADASGLAARAYLILERAVSNQGDDKRAKHYLEQALALSRTAGEPQSEMESLRRLGIMVYYEADFNGAKIYFEQSLTIARQIGDRRGESAALINLGIWANHEGDYAKVQAIFEQSLAIDRQTGNRRDEGSSLYNIAIVLSQVGNHAGRRASLEQSLAISREIDDRVGENQSLRGFGDIAKEQGHYAEARAYYEQSLAISREIDDRVGENQSLRGFGDIAKEQGHYAEARAYYEQSLAIIRQLGNRWEEGIVLSLLGEAIRLEGDVTKALDYGQQANVILKEIGVAHAQSQSLFRHGNALFDSGNLAAAVEAYEEALTLTELGYYGADIEIRAALARVAMAQGKLKQALAQVKEIVTWLETNTISDVASKLQVQLTCYQVLRASAVTDATLEARVTDILTQAHTTLMALAERISDLSQRQNFLEKVPYNREIMAAWEVENG